MFDIAVERMNLGKARSEAAVVNSHTHTAWCWANSRGNPTSFLGTMAPEDLHSKIIGQVTYE